MFRLKEINIRSFMTTEVKEQTPSYKAMMMPVTLQGGCTPYFTGGADCAAWIDYQDPQKFLDEQVS